MTGFLFDTNIPSELSRPHPDPRVVSFIGQVDPDRVFFSVLTLGELARGIAALPPSHRRTNLQTWMDNEVRPWFGSRILPVSAEIAEIWGNLAAQAKLKGTPLAVIEGLIGATALHHGLTLVTRNIRDFRGLGLTLIDPWQSRSRVQK